MDARVEICPLPGYMSCGLQGLHQAKAHERRPSVRELKDVSCDVMSLRPMASRNKKWCRASIAFNLYDIYWLVVWNMNFTTFHILWEP